MCPEVQGVYLFIRRTKQKNIVFRILENKIEPNDLFCTIPLLKIKIKTNRVLFRPEYLVMCLSCW